MLRVIHLGLGEIGKGSLATLLAQPGSGLKLVAVADTHPDLAGRNLRDLLANRGIPHIPHLKVHSSLDAALKASKPDVATMTTGSRTVDVKATLERLISAGVHVVSTCEELAFPTLRAPGIAAELDRKARRAGVAILGTGVNPGFAMDAFALACTAPCLSVSSIHITRTLDAAKRRQQLQKKVGAGMELREVQALIRRNAIGHVGLGESIALIAHGLGWKLGAIREKFTALTADRPIASDYYKVARGQVRGLFMTATGMVAGKPKIKLDLTMALGAETYDEVRIEGRPNLTIRTTTGFPGDSSTTALLINAARRLPELRPGVRTMLDLLQIRSRGA